LYFIEYYLILLAVFATASSKITQDIDALSDKHVSNNDFQQDMFMKRLARLLITLMLLGLYPLSIAAAGGGSSAPVEGPGYLPLKPAFVVNIRDGKRSRFLQVQVQLKLSDMTMGEKILHHDSVIRHTMLMLLSGQEVTDLYSTVGKERLRVKALESVRAALKDEIKQLPIDNLYFTNFIIQ